MTALVLWCRVCHYCLVWRERYVPTCAECLNTDWTARPCFDEPRTPWHLSKTDAEFLKSIRVDAGR